MTPEPVGAAPGPGATPRGTAARLQSRVAPAAPALPTELELQQGESVTLPIGAATTFSSGNTRVLQVELQEGNLRLSALEPGRALVYVIMPRGVHVLRVVVERKRHAPSTRRAPEVLWDENVRLRTGGLVEHAMVGATYTRDALGHSLPLQLALRGGRGPVRYSLSSMYIPARTGTSLVPSLDAVQGSRPLLVHELSLEAGPVDARLGGLVPDQPFDAMVTSTGFTREGRLSANARNNHVLLGMRGIASRLGLPSPERMTLRLGRQVGDFRVSAGSFLTPSSTSTSDPVPFADVSWDPTQNMHAAFSFGTSRGLSATPRDLIGASFAGAISDCRLQGEYATFLGTGTTATGATYEPVVPHQFGARGECRVEGVSAGINATRMPGPARTFGEIARFGTHVGAPLGPVEARLSAQYWANGDPTRRALLGNANLTWQPSKGNRVTAMVSANRRGEQNWFSEVVGADRRQGLLQGSVALSSTHSGGRLPVTSGTLGAALEPSKELRVGASVGTGLDFETMRPTPVFARANVQWLPVPNYSFLAWADHQLLSTNFRIQAGIQYAFGDALPREPLLYPFRSDSLAIEAFEDLDRDGVRDEKEPLLSGVPACVDATCGVTGPDGVYRVEDLAEGLHEASVDTSTVAGAMPTNESRRKVGVGRYREERMSVGVRYRGLFKIRTYVDQNHNGRRDPDETETLRGLGVKITAPGLTTTVVPPGGEGELEWTQAGPWEARIDGFTLPAGYVANGGSTAKGVLKPWETATVEVGVSVLRSIAGVVCVDANTNDDCEPSEERVGLVHVDADGQQGVANTEGKYFVPFMPSGTWTVKIPEIEVPGGLVQKFVPTVTFGAIPRAETDVAVPLRRQTQVKRPSTYVVTWPKVGSAEAAELGGHFMDGASLRAAKGKEGAPSRDDAKVLKQLAGLAKRPNTKIFLTVNMDPQLPPDEAEADAHDLARTLGRWFVKTHKMKPADVVTEVAMPAGRTPRVSVRVYQLRSRGR